MQQQKPVNEAPVSAATSAELAKLQGQRNGGAGWFYAIAVFSVINLLILAVGGGVNFLIGLGITQLIDVLCLLLAKQMDPAAGAAFRIIGGAITVVIAGLFLFFGTLAKRGLWWAFVVGMVLYAIDGLIFLWFQDWFSLGFHAFALMALSGGLKAQLQLDRLEHRSQSSEICCHDRTDPPGNSNTVSAAE